MIVFENVQIVNCGTGISMPADYPMVAEGLSISGCNVAIDLRDEPSPEAVSRSMEPTWMDILAACFATIRLSKGRSIDDRGASFRDSELGRMLARSHDVDTLLSQLLVAESRGFTLEPLMSRSMREWLQRANA